MQITNTKRRFLRGASALLAASLFALPMQASHAQASYVRLVIAFPPGGSSDVLARAFGEQLGKVLGKTVVVENRPGGNGAIAAQNVIHSEPNGETLWLTTSGAVVINPVLYPKLSYDMNALQPVSLVANVDEVLVVNKDNPANDPEAFVKRAKADENARAIASSGIGSMPHMAVALFSDATGVPFLHVPMKGAAPAVAAVIGKHVEGFFGDISAVLPQVQGGSLKAIGIGAQKRNPLFPEVKTFEELGYKGIELNNWSAIFVSKNVPAKTVDALNQAIRKAVASPELKKILAPMGIDLQASSPAEMSAMVEHDLQKWKQVIVKHDIKPE
ncbi:tripartite tricarboxylate transporter substrate binding protein [Pigmentiphaga soli]|uniref:Tripartite tricarboxylate transporter substrate binding protein n=1 Tax=Pigmentiphaga soli TaxID=1007095 RepID=A0ABP8HEF0_9BURK